MNITFKIKYRTQWGEIVWVSLSQGCEPPIRMPLSTIDGEVWNGNMELPDATDDVITYRYYIERDGHEERAEVATMPHIIFPKRGQKVYEQNDWWRDVRHVAGIAVPVFSLRSEDSQGVGDFGDLMKLVRWAEQTGMRAVQILPINDTTISHSWTDSYPYNSISIFALHPMYLDLKQLGTLADKKAMDEYEKERQRVNNLPQIDYEAVNNLKRSYMRKMYEQDGAKVLKTKGFKTFYGKNKDWLLPYAAFSYLRDKYGTSQFSAWPAYSTYNTEEVEKLAKKEHHEIAYHYYLQYFLHLQLLTVANFARQNKIILKGDIPIGISTNSVEAWVEPFYFNMDEQTGAPPDIFAKDGQNWGFPTYNWDVMARDGYRWWIRRMRKMAEYFSAYRIDHILGFFRIWEIPYPHKSGLMGQFSPALPMTEEDITRRGVPFIPDMYLQDRHDPTRYHIRISAKEEESYKNLSGSARLAFDRMYEDFFYHRHNDFWYNEAMKKLPALTRSTQMIACGEDLGMIPACVEKVMNKLQIMSLEIQSMPKAPGLEFGNLQDNPVLSVCTISSHDTPTLRGWWEEDPERAQRYYTHVLHLKGEAPRQLPGWICEMIIRRHLECPSAFCIITLQDWLSIDESIRLPDAAAERINVPANPRHYWRYRMHINLERLLQPNSFTEHVKNIIHNA
ncbi:MAG: 4-alpha-glucanotransferase [Bacteroidaceae bacterium]|nr:4-alpha-glucanotransferase [Bacteroidaceae bacterium]